MLYFLGHMVDTRNMTQDSTQLIQILRAVSDAAKNYASTTDDGATKSRMADRVVLVETIIGAMMDEADQKPSWSKANLMLMAKDMDNAAELTRKDQGYEFSAKDADDAITRN